MRIFRRLSLTTRLTLLALATFSPIAILTVVSYVEARSDQRRENIEQAREYTRSLATALDNTALDLEGFSLAAALSLGTRNEPFTQENSQAYLRTLNSRYEFLRTIFITDLDGKILAQAEGDDTGRDLGERPYIQALKQGAETVWSGGLTGIETGQVTVAFARLIRSTDGSPRGFFVAAFYPVNLAERLPQDLPSDGHMVLIDQSGQLFFSSKDPDFEIVEQDVSYSPLVQAALAGQEVALDSDELPFDEGKRFGALVSLPHLQWAFGFTRSQAALDSSLTSTLIRDLAILVAIGTGGVVALLITGRQMSRPLANLATTATRMAEGRPVYFSTPTSDPDVSKLRTAFIDMSGAVKQREEELAEQARVLNTLEQVGAWIASDLDFEKTVQAVTDAGTRLTEAEFGAFFYNVVDEKDDAHQLFALSGMDKDAFTESLMPRAIDLFGATAHRDATIRVDDVILDSRSGNDTASEGMPEGPLPVRSYLAVPVLSGSHKALGGLFFGHSQPAMFSARHERLATGIASWAAIALDNARLYADGQRVQEDLRNANRAKDEFLGLVSHELRTPTTTIYGGLRVLVSRNGSLSEEATKELLTNVSEEAERMVRLIENLLVFARVELGKQIDGRAVSPIDLATTAVHSFRRTHPQRQVQLDYPEDLPLIRAEPTYFEQILSNLLSNADKYSPANPPIEVRLQRAGNEVQVVVSDHGPGVAPDEVDLIFESFYRSQKTSRVAGGHGLGLTVCKRLVEGQGGSISAANRLEGGLQVTFSFPMALEFVEEVPIASGPAETAAPVDSL